MDTNKIAEIFKSNGIKATGQRIAVYDYLVEHPTHPDVETVYEYVVRENPSFSKTTVYNCLQALAKCGLIIPVTIDSDRIRYDADTSFHGHFKCEKCKKIYDFKCTDEKASAIDGFLIKHRDVYYSGICSHCR